MPLTNTVLDFWRLVKDFEVSTIVMLNDMHTSVHNVPFEPYWNNGGNNEPLEVGPFSITIKEEEKMSDNVWCKQLLLNEKKKKTYARVIRQFRLTSWPENQGSVPKSSADLILLNEEMRSWQRTQGQKSILVHCMDGVTRSGLLCVASSLLEQLDKAGEADIFNIVMQSRKDRPQFITNMEQYNYLHDLAKEYAARSANRNATSDAANTYANV